MRAAPTLLLLLPVLPACAPLPTTRVYAPPSPQALAARRVLVDAARQVQRCYRAPRGTSAAKRISTTLGVRYTREGTLIGLPEVIRQSGVDESNAADADAMAEAARLAVVRCQPLTLPPDMYEGVWDNFTLTFSLRLSA